METITKSHTITYVFLFRCQFALANSSSIFKFYLNKSGETRTQTDVKQHGSGRLQLAQLYTPPRWKKLLMSVAALYTWDKNERRENSDTKLCIYSKSSTVTSLGRRKLSATQGSIVVAFKKTSLTQRNVLHHALHIVASKIEIRLTYNMGLRGWYLRSLCCWTLYSNL